MATDKQNLKKAIDQAIESLMNAKDSEIMSLLEERYFDRLLLSIAVPKGDTSQSIYDYLLENKNRLAPIAWIQSVIMRHYAIKGILNGNEVYVAPCFLQWYDDGVMFIQSKSPFQGSIGLYRGGELKFAVAARDTKPGEDLGPDDLMFLEVEEAKTALEKSALPSDIDSLDRAVSDLKSHLALKVEDEKVYQEYIMGNPWVLGAQYKNIQSHKALDDENIPDFSGVRIRDGSRDIIEIKPPFLKIFRKNDEFRSEFNDAWNQVERYLDFTRTEADYLFRKKHLRFENPNCYLIMGYELSEIQIKMIRAKERMNPSITILTYNDLLAMVRSTVNFIKQLIP